MSLVRKPAFSHMICENKGADLLAISDFIKDLGKLPLPLFGNFFKQFGEKYTKLGK